MVALAGLLCAAISASPAEGLAIQCAKILTMNAEDAVHAPGMVWIEDGAISYVGGVRDVPAGWTLLEEDEMWAMPGMVDLHTHIHSGGFADTNDMVHSVNPELRAQAAGRRRRWLWLPRREPERGV